MKPMPFRKAWLAGYDIDTCYELDQRYQSVLERRAIKAEKRRIEQWLEQIRSKKPSKTLNLIPELCPL